MTSYDEGLIHNQSNNFIISAFSAWILAAFFSLLSIMSGHALLASENYSVSLLTADVIRYAAFGFGIIAFARAGRC